jgi:hypothetical protein
MEIIRLRMVRWAGRLAPMGEMTEAFTLVIGKTKGKIPLGVLDLDKNIVLK